MTNSYETFIQLLSYQILSFLGFTMDEKMKDEIEKYPTKLMVVTSHTSVYDFVIGFCVYQIHFRKKYHIQILMKQSFENYVSPLLKWIDSRFRILRVEEDKHGMVKQIVEQLQFQNHYVIGLAPEGTRRCTPQIRKGFHYIAKELHLPILYLGIDYDKKRISVEPLYTPKSSFEEDEKWFQQTCTYYTPLFPDQCYWTREEYLDQERTISSQSSSSDDSSLPNISPIS